MYITNKKSQIGVLQKPCKMCGNGLGDAIQQEYGGQSKTGKTVLPVVTQIATMFGQGTGTGLITSVIPKGVLKSAGIDINPASLVLAPMTFGASMLPGVSKLLGKVFNVFGDMFKKATHMESCMKGWDDGGIRGIAAGVVPYPVSFDFNFEQYMMKNFPQFLRQYQILQAGGQWASVGVDTYLNRMKNKVLNMANRRRKIQDIFLRIVRENPDIMKLECVSLPKGRAETGYQGEGAGLYWENFREAARQEEYGMIVKEVNNIPGEIDRLVSPFKAKETWGEIVRSRNTGLIVPIEQGGQLRMPENIVGVSRGAFVMTLKTPQGQPIRK